MKLRAFKKDYFKITVANDFEVTYSGDKQTTRWIFDPELRNLPVSISTDNTNKLIIESPMPFILDAIIVYVRDRNGTILYEDQSIDDTVIVSPTTMWRVISNQPVINALGIVEGYKIKTGAPTAYANTFITNITTDLPGGLGS